MIADVKRGLQCGRQLLEDVDYICLEYCGRDISFGIAMVKEMRVLLMEDGEW